METFTAGIIKIDNEYEAHIFVDKGWINTNPQWRMYKTRRAAKKRAERVAIAFGILLEWEKGKR